MLFENPLFRDQALKRRGQTESLDQLLRVTAPREWLVLGGLAVAAAAVAVWAVFGGVEPKIAADCVLVLPGERHAVVSDGTGIVVELLARPGDRVERGQAIARIRSRELMRLERAARARSTLPQGLLSDTAGSDDGMEAVRSLLESSEVIVSPAAGEVALLSLAPGQSVTEGETVGRIRGGGEGRVVALSTMPGHRTDAVAQGMLVRVAPGPSAGAGAALEGEVAALESGNDSVAGWLLDYGFTPAPGGRIVRVALRAAPEHEFRDGTPCRAWFVQPRTSLLRLLIAAQALPRAGRETERSGSP